MKYIFILVRYTLIIIFLASCTKTYDDIVVFNKSCILKHNFIALSTVDGNDGNIDVTYTFFEDGENKVLTKTIELPAIIGGENIRITYDSIVQYLQSGNRKSAAVLSSRREIQRNYNKHGADYLVIKNNSKSVIRYGIIGNQPLEYFTIEEIGRAHV